MQHPARNVCPKFKVDRFSRFHTGACHMLTSQETFPCRNSSNHENYNTKYPLNTFPDQITIYQISF